MTFDVDEILAILDRCSEAFTFPALDNGYVYLASTRLSLYRSALDWAIVIEVFGFSPRAGLPDTHVQTFASRLHNRNTKENYLTLDAYEHYLANNPHNESRNFFPILEGKWQDEEDAEMLAKNGVEVVVRDRMIPLPDKQEYAKHNIILEQPPRVRVYELCRYLADVAKDQVLALPQEQRISILPEMKQILQLEEWHHPDIVSSELPSISETFQQLATVLATGDLEQYHPSNLPNTHWSNWPESGQL